MDAGDIVVGSRLSQRRMSSQRRIALEVSRQTIEGLADTHRTRKSRGRRQRIRRPYVIFREFPQQVATALGDQTDATTAVGENQSCDLVRVGALVGTDVNPADRCADQHERSVFARCLQEIVEIGDRLLDSLVRRAAIAPPQPRAIVPADTCGAGHLRLHERPVDRKRTTAALEQHRRAAAAVQWMCILRPPTSTMRPGG